MGELTTGQVILFVIGQLIVAAGIYGGIRTDLKHLHEKLKELKETGDQAHRRIDDMLRMNSTGEHPPYRRVK